MIKKDKIKFKNGNIKTQIRVVEGYRPGPGMPPKQRTIKSFGYLEDNQDQEAFLEMVQEFDKNHRKESIRRIEVPQNAKMYSKENRCFNYGYKFLESIYDQLGIGLFIEQYIQATGFKGQYPLKEIFKFLVLSRILHPDSKRATCQMKDGYYKFETNFRLEDIYRSLDQCAKFMVPIQQHLNDEIKELIGRDLSFAFYDVTNYYFETDFPDRDGGLRKRGVSKEHRVDPIVQMGLFIDSKGVPVSMELFPGNTSDSLTLSPVMKEIKMNYDFGRLIVVADKGLNSSANINEIINHGDGYVVSQILRGKKGTRYHAEMFDEKSYIVNEDGTYKYKLYKEDYEGKDRDGSSVMRQRQVLIYWSKADAEMAARKRAEKLKTAESMTKNPVYGIPQGGKAYFAETIIDQDTGKKVVKPKKVHSVNIEKAENDAKFDGFFCILTSEMEYDEQMIRYVYGGLWNIEQSFRVMKSDLQTRPVFVNHQDHIRAHFLICFVALLVVRILQYKMGKNALSVERIARALNTATCQVLRGGILHLDDVGGAIAFKKSTDSQGKIIDSLEYSAEDEIALDYRKIQNTFNVDFYYSYPREEAFTKFLSSISI